MKHRLGNYHISEKGYPRFHSGPYRHRYVHRILMERKLRRKLKPDEDVHHRDLDKTNFKLSNLKVLGHQEHGFVSAKQHHYMTKIWEPAEKKQWDEYFGAGWDRAEAVNG